MGSNEIKPSTHSDSELPESVFSSEESFGSFVTPGHYNINSSSTGTLISPEQQEQASLLPPDYGQSAIQMLNMEIQAHAQTQEALQEQYKRSFNLERHYVHQTIIISAWHKAWSDASTKLEQKSQEMYQLGVQIESLKQENDILKEEVDTQREIRRPAST
ncbi:hypothetical protein B0J12DRAFT_639153 [Macrophomina phaseolina]|uniref:Uncharacterized protein n=1 Tax=Macrophomina phaseolina TaxID=35725 RepID=A0ABQ8GV19_9PEZI|nr:hypothetical protein B0J12DRAFT_639153 [Macrophomina phaseolina]